MLTEGQGFPIAFSCTSAKGNEPNEACRLLEAVWFETETMRFMQADKAYDSKEFRIFCMVFGFYPLVDYRRMGNRLPLSKTILKISTRWTIERTFSWLKAKYRRIVVRWERRSAYWKGFIGMGIIMLWVNKLLG